jgi:hypothetical protein
MTISEAKAMFAEMLKTWLLHHNKTNHNFNHNVPERERI